MTEACVLEFDFEKYRCDQESTGYREIWENPPQQQENKPTNTKKKSSTTKNLLFGKPSRIKAQEELTSALSKGKRTKKGNKRTKKKKKGKPVPKLVDPSRGILEIQNLSQTYPFSNCCNQGFIDRSVKSKTRTEDQSSLWGYTASTPESLKGMSISPVLIDSSPPAKDDNSVVIESIKHTAVVSDSEPEEILPTMTGEGQVSDSEPEPEERALPSVPTTIPTSPWSKEAYEEDHDDYENYTTSELRKLVDQYGFKPVKSRRGMLQLLRSCDFPPGAPAASTNQLHNEESLDELIYNRLDDGIKSLPSMYQKIISYEPIDITNLQTTITDELDMKNINVEFIKRYCDSRGVCFTTME